MNNVRLLLLTTLQCYYYSALSTAQGDLERCAHTYIAIQNACEFVPYLWITRCIISYGSILSCLFFSVVNAQFDPKTD